MAYSLQDLRTWIPSCSADVYKEIFPDLERPLVTVGQMESTSHSSRTATESRQLTLWLDGIFPEHEDISIPNCTVFASQPYEDLLAAPYAVLKQMCDPSPSDSLCPTVDFRHTVVAFLERQIPLSQGDEERRPVVEWVEPASTEGEECVVRTRYLMQWLSQGPESRRERYKYLAQKYSKDALKQICLSSLAVTSWGPWYADITVSLLKKLTSGEEGPSSTSTFEAGAKHVPQCFPAALQKLHAHLQLEAMPNDTDPSLSRGDEPDAEWVWFYCKALFAHYVMCLDTNWIYLSGMHRWSQRARSGETVGTPTDQAETERTLRKVYTSALHGHVAEGLCSPKFFASTAKGGRVYPPVEHGIPITTAALQYSERCSDLGESTPALPKLLIQMPHGWVYWDQLWQSDLAHEFIKDTSDHGASRQMELGAFHFLQLSSKKKNDPLSPLIQAHLAQDSANDRKLSIQRIRIHPSQYFSVTRRAQFCLSPKSGNSPATSLLLHCHWFQNTVHVMLTGDSQRPCGHVLRCTVQMALHLENRVTYSVDTLLGPQISDEASAVTFRSSEEAVTKFHNIIGRQMIEHVHHRWSGQVNGQTSQTARCQAAWWSQVYREKCRPGHSSVSSLPLFMQGTPELILSVSLGSHIERQHGTTPRPGTLRRIFHALDALHAL